MNQEQFIQDKVKNALEALYGASGVNLPIQVQATRKEFEGDATLVTFPLLKTSRKSPEATGQEIGEWLKANTPEIEGFNVVKGFLNIKFAPSFWKEVYGSIAADGSFGHLPSTGKTVMVEYSSPNTNKPLHLGHIRNILLGWSVSRLLEENGHKVIKTNIVNDRGIHICKSMVAWKKAGNGVTPESSGKKGDHLVGDFYVKFNDLYKAEVAQLEAQGMSKEEAEEKAPILQEARQMLVKWEQGDPETVELWKMMNSWVYAGFDETYAALGVGFDRIYYESQTYLHGKSLVEEGLRKGVFERMEDGSVWCRPDRRRAGPQAAPEKGRHLGVHHPGPGHCRREIYRIQSGRARLRGWQRAELPLSGAQTHTQETGLRLGRQHLPPLLRYGGAA